MSRLLLVVVSVCLIGCLLFRLTEQAENEQPHEGGNWDRDQRAAPRAAIGDIMYRFHKRAPKYGIGMGSRFGGRGKRLNQVNYV